MNSGEIPGTLAPQRWQRPLNAPPGYWRQQLATKYLELAGRGDIDALLQLLVQNPELRKRGNHNHTRLLVDQGGKGIKFRCPELSVF